MSSNWQNAYKHLREFIPAHPEIRIEECRVYIPDGVREEFYRLFDTVREAFVQEHYATLPVDVAALIERYAGVKKEVLSRLGLERVSMPGSVELFLRNPQQALTSALFDMMFELLQGKAEIQAFERQALGNLDSSLIEWSGWAYPYWVALSLIILLEPDAALQIALDSQAQPMLKELKHIPFGSPAPHPTLRFPEFLIHSRRIDKCVALKLELASEIGTYTTDSRSERKQAMRNCGKTQSGLGPRVLLVYLVPRLQEIPIVADLDARRVCCPEIMVECQAQRTDRWDHVQQHQNILQPKLGTCIVLNEPLPEPGPSHREDNIHLLGVGLDSSRLGPIIDALS